MSENRIFSITLILILLFSQTLFSEQLNANTLQNDLKYYQKISKQNKLGSNDRYYILLRLQQKYEGTKVNTSALKAEIKKVLNKTPANQTAKNSTGTVTGISVIETDSASQISIQSDNVKRSNYFLLKDPDPNQPIKLVLDLYDAQDQLPQENREIDLEKSVFSHIQAGQFEEKPDKIVRVVASMKKERPYKISNENGSWMISAQKEKNSQDKPSAEKTAPAMPAPAVVIVPVAPSVKQQKNETSTAYAIEVGDVLAITVYPAEELSREVVVQPEGEIAFPLVGNIKARGLSTDELAASIKKSLAKFVSNPKVSVSMRKFSRRQIFITGEVHAVGTFDYKENLRLMEFISSLGGFTTEANRKEIKIYRGPSNKKQVYMVNIEQVILSGDFSKDFLLEPGDIIEVQKGSTKVSVLGDIANPGYYDYRDNMTMTELISDAKGYSDNASITDIRIIRLETQKDKNNNQIHVKRVIKVNFKKILSGKDDDVIIKSGDTIYIPRITIAKANWFLNNVLPWLTLITLIIAVGGKT